MEDTLEKELLEVGVNADQEAIDTIGQFFDQNGEPEEINRKLWIMLCGALTNEHELQNADKNAALLFLYDQLSELITKIKPLASYP